MQRWSLARRLVILLTSGLGLLWLVAVGISATLVWHELDEVLDSALQETAQRVLPLVVADLDEYDEAEGGRAVGDTVEGHREYILYQVRDAKGHVILRSHDAPAEALPAPLVQGFATIDGRRFYTDISATTGIAVQVTEKPGHRFETILDGIVGLLLPIVIVLPLAGIAVYWTVRQLVRPIDAVREAIRARSGADLTPIEGTPLPTELQPIIADVNRLLERLDLALAGERAFAANSAHELRTPIAAAMAQLQRLAADLGASAHRPRVDVILGSLRRLANMVEKMLQLARADSGIAITSESADLLPVLTLLVDELRRSGAAAGRIALTEPDLPHWRRRIDIDAFGIVLRNLVDNALNHGDQTQPVYIFLDAAGDLHVVNRGPVVPAEKLDQLTERFRRGTTEAAGSGLGLAIVETILRQAGGKLALYSPAKGTADGFEAVVSLP
ncbi:MAG: HAMP domain-containing histidine kinase [Proteobacteria bacterium]|nr:HAMP domain-containing histidine kinase [Pseudomonadota bacterium]